MSLGLEEAALVAVLVGTAPYSALAFRDALALGGLLGSHDSDAVETLGGIN